MDKKGSQPSGGKKMSNSKSSKRSCKSMKSGQSGLPGPRRA